MLYHRQRRWPNIGPTFNNYLIVYKLGFAVRYVGAMYWTEKRDGRPGTCLIEYFYSNINGRNETEVPARFAANDSACKCIIETIAFGMGIQIPDISDDHSLGAS